MELIGQWADSPPAHWSLAALAGHEPKSKAKPKAQDLSALGGVPGMTRE